jgi:acyl-CoA reductase-like NAD-dependent aldehyde dehydrogenase
MAAAAKHLTPVTLELGGKCPLYIDSTVDLKVAAKRIVIGKWGSSCGQACISPNHLLVEESVVPKLVILLHASFCFKPVHGQELFESFCDLLMMHCTEHFCT